MSSPDSSIPGEWEQGRAELVLVFVLVSLGICGLAMCFCIWIVRQSDHYLDAWLCRSDEDGCLDTRSCYMTVKVCTAVKSCECADDSDTDDSDEAHHGEDAAAIQNIRRLERPPPLAPPPIGATATSPPPRYSPTHAPAPLSERPAEAGVGTRTPETPTLIAAADVTTATSGHDALSQ